MVLLDGREVKVDDLKVKYSTAPGAPKKARFGCCYFTTNLILTMVFLSLVHSYPGWQHTFYSWGIRSFDTAAARNDAFDLQMSLGAALGVSQMPVVDHFKIVAGSMLILCWIELFGDFPKIQLLVRGAAILVAGYMAIYVAVASNNNFESFDYTDAIISFLLLLSGLGRLCMGGGLPHGHLLVKWTLFVSVIVAAASYTSYLRSPFLQHVYAVRDQCTKPPKGLWYGPFPGDWIWSPLPFGGNNDGWPKGPWPKGPLGPAWTNCHPGPYLEPVAANEYLALYYLPLEIALTVILLPVGTYIYAVFKA